MSQLSSACLIAGLALAAGGASAQEPANDDPHAWLEDVAGERQLDWVKARNAKAEAELASTPEFKSLEAEILAILDSDAKIPGVYKQGEWYYNFWQDKANPRGIWRRTTLAEYRKPNPKWDVILDIDALNKAKPASSKGLYLRKVAVSSTMGVGVRVDTQSIAA